MRKTYQYKIDDVEIWALHFGMNKEGTKIFIYQRFWDYVRGWQRGFTIHPMSELPFVFRDLEYDRCLYLSFKDEHEESPFGTNAIIELNGGNWGASRFFSHNDKLPLPEEALHAIPELVEALMLCFGMVYLDEDNGLTNPLYLMKDLFENEYDAHLADFLDDAQKWHSLDGGDFDPTAKYVVRNEYSGGYTSVKDEEIFGYIVDEIDANRSRYLFLEYLKRKKIVEPEKRQVYISMVEACKADKKFGAQQLLWRLIARLVDIYKEVRHINGYTIELVERPIPAALIDTQKFFGEPYKQVYVGIYHNLDIYLVSGDQKKVVELDSGDWDTLLKLGYELERYCNLMDETITNE